MKRDMALIRKMLLTVEAHENGYAPRDMTFEGYSEEQIGFHAKLIIDADLRAESTRRIADRRAQRDASPS